MKMIPLLFQADMVQAMLRGWKTNTSRLRGLSVINEDPARYMLLGSGTDAKGNLLFTFFDTAQKNNSVWVKCPYGNVGDTIWCRENGWVDNNHIPGLNEGSTSVYYKADYNQLEEYEKIMIRDHFCPFPSIHMPFFAARIFARIKKISIKRLRDFTDAEAKAEGIYRWADADAYFDYIKSLDPAINGISTILANELAIRKKMSGHALYRDYIHAYNVPKEAAVINNAVHSFIGLFYSKNQVPFPADFNSEINNPWVWSIAYEILSTKGNPDPEKYYIGKKLKAQ